MNDKFLFNFFEKYIFILHDYGIQRILLTRIFGVITLGLMTHRVIIDEITHLGLFIGLLIIGFNQWQDESKDLANLKLHNSIKVVRRTMPFLTYVRLFLLSLFVINVFGVFNGLGSIPSILEFFFFLCYVYISDSITPETPPGSKFFKFQMT